jgi:hypothetical protein
MSYREKYYIGLKDDPKMHVKLTGSWETMVGEQDTFFHILEYENYGGYDKTVELLRTTEVRESPTSAAKTYSDFGKSSIMTPTRPCFHTSPPALPN